MQRSSEAGGVIFWGYCMVINTGMQALILFLTKKKPATAGDVDGWICPRYKASWMYSFMDLCFDEERENNLTLGGDAPGEYLDCGLSPS